MDECDTTAPAPEPCQGYTSYGSYYEPPTFCEEDALPGSDFCRRHAE